MRFMSCCCCVQELSKLNAAAALQKAQQTVMETSQPLTTRSLPVTSTATTATATAATALSLSVAQRLQQQQQQQQQSEQQQQQRDGIAALSERLKQTLREYVAPSGFVCAF